MLVFRNIEEKDVEIVAGLEKDIFSDSWTSNSIKETIKQPQAFIVVAEEEGKIAGYCIIYHVLDEGEIARIAVDEKWRRRGVGHGLLDYICECCGKRNVERLLLDVRESNESARAFYKNYGFEEDGIRKNFYEKPREHAVLMSKKLF